MLPTVCKLIREAGLCYQVLDRRLLLPSVTFEADIELRPYQRHPVAEALKRKGGMIVAPPGSGKTVMAMAIIAGAGQPALWLTHTKDLADQARERAVEFLGLDADEIGMIGAGRRQIGKRLTIGMVQTLAKGMSDELANRVGLVVLDEAHHAPAATFTEVLNRLPARYRYGLTATPYRRDGLHPIMFYTCGYMIAEVARSDLFHEGRIIRPQIRQIHTGFWYDYRDDYRAMITALT